MSSDTVQEFDLIIAGAGPSGAVAAIKMSGKGYRVALIDKAVFPRDKICGDALSPDCIRQLPWVSPSLAERFDRLEAKHELKGAKILVPNAPENAVDFQIPKEQRGYVVSRWDLDQMLMEEVKSLSDIVVLEGTEIKELEPEANSILLQTSKGNFRTRMLIGADGNHSIVAKKLGGRKQIDRNHHCAALRQYYENVAWPEGTDFIELHFIEDVLPGYLWVFPLTNNRANVGIGMLSEDVSKNKINLKKVLETQLKEHPILSQRFQNAKPLETVKGFGIPLGTKKYKLSGANFLLAGDAACLVDPVSGEGIANAIRSGRFAADYALEALETGKMDAKSLQAYDKKIYAMLWDELRFSRFLQRTFKHTFLLNTAFWLIRTNKRYRRFITYLFSETDFFSKWSKPNFYKNLIIGKRN